MKEERRQISPPAAAAPALLAAFTLIEMLVVIAIIGILAAIAVPALNMFKPNVAAAATQQLMADIGRARQLAISQRTTVYMVFVPTNFYNDTEFSKLTADEQKFSDSLLDKQMIGYALVSLRSLGDQPGSPTPRYLSPWKTLPDGSFIALSKFRPRDALYPTPPVTNFITGETFDFLGFERTRVVPFPSARVMLSSNVELPFIAFDAFGQLTSRKDEAIPIARGNVSFARDVKRVATRKAPTFTETPVGNSTNTSFNLIYIDNLTGRARVERQEVK